MNTADKKKIFTAAANLKNDCHRAQTNEGREDIGILIGFMCDFSQSVMKMVNTIDSVEKKENGK